MTKPIRTGLPFNPLAWGTLSFTFWLTVITIPNVGKSQTYIAWIFFGLSCILWLSILCPSLRRLIGAKTTQKFILPTIFLVSVFVLIMGPLSALQNVPQSLQIVVILGILLWLIAYISIIIWSFKNKRLGTLVGIGLSASLIVLGILNFFREFLPAAPWAIVALGVIMLIITLLKSKIGRKFPLV